MKLSKVFKLLLVLCILAFIFISIKAISSSPAKKASSGSPITANVSDLNDTTGYNFDPSAATGTAVDTTDAVTHMKTPDNVRGIYVSANSFLYKPFLDRLDNIIKTTTVNAIVVDIKDAPGVITYDIGMDTPCVQPQISKKVLEDKLNYYHSKGIYIIARVAVFRDACFVKNNLDLSVLKKDGTPWRDTKGNYWLSPHEDKTAQYIADIAKHVYDDGFDEIQLDYVRYPSDGDMQALQYEYSSTVPASSTNEEKRKGTLKNFVGQVRTALGKDIPLSADIFGMVLTNRDDLGIGQHLDDFADNVDYISGMIYPSHFPNNWNGIKVPNKSPYDTIFDSAQIGLDRLAVTYGTTTALKMMRPWLQDFSIFGVTYNAPEVTAQIKALDDLGIHSFLLWNASNRYTTGVMDK